MRATAALVIELPITIPPTGTRYCGFGSKIPSASTRPSVVAAATESAIAIGPSACGTFFARPRAVSDPNVTITASRPTTSSRLSSSKIAWIT